MKQVVLFAAVAAALVGFAVDCRPPLDKSDYKGTVNVQLNPWFPLDKPAVHGLGGPNRAWLHGLDWESGMRQTAEYGVTVWTPEINSPGGWAGVWRELLDLASKGDVPVKVGMFFGMYADGGVEGVVSSMKETLKPFAGDLKTNSAVARIGGAPLMVVYNVGRFKAEDWGKVFSALDSEFGRMAYLMDVDALVRIARQRAGGGDEKTEEVLTEYLEHFDGISCYASGVKNPWDRIVKVMRAHPNKVFEAPVHQCYCNHFHWGGNSFALSEDWRQSVERALACDPDAIMLTNLFDHYENSLVLPCYDREDLLLRYLEYALARHRPEKRKFRAQTKPEIVLTSHAAVLLGWQGLDFEVMGFPVDADNKDVEVTLEICNMSGQPIYSFPAKTLSLDEFAAEKFSVPSTRFASLRGIVPRVVWKWNGQTGILRNPMTVIDPSIRPYRLYWARSTKNQLQVENGDDWRMDGIPVGKTHVPQADGLVQFESGMLPTWTFGNASGVSRVGIRRDGVEFFYENEAGKGVRSQLLNVPQPKGSLHWYTVEMENASGHKFQSLPIWETDGSRAEKVSLPVWKEDGSIVDLQVGGARVPFWHYPCARDCGQLLVDESGWGHNGSINGSGYGGGHLGYTGYNHYHNGPIGVSREKTKRLWRPEGEGGYLRFDGSNDYVMVMGGTAFPGACTYEMSVRPAKFGREMGLIGTYNGQMLIDLTADGRVRVIRRSAAEGVGGKAPAPSQAKSAEVIAQKPLTVGSWSRIAVVYDLRKITLFVNGKFEGESVSAPLRDHEYFNYVIFGSKASSTIFKSEARFDGDMRQMRIYGRNLSPEEFLK